MNLKERFAFRREIVKFVLGGGHPDAVAKEHGVSRASVYNWVREYKEGGARQLIHPDGDKRFALPGLTPFTTIRLVRAIVDRHPTWSADKMAEFLSSMGQEIHPRTLRNIFNRLGIGSKKDRQKAAAAFRSYGVQDEEFSDDDLRLILAELDSLNSGEEKGSRPEEVLVQDRVKFPKGVCSEPLAMELIVDTFAPHKRIFATFGQAGVELSVSALIDIKRRYEGNGEAIVKICTPRKAQYSRDLGAFDYPNFLQWGMGAEQSVRPINAKYFDSRIQSTWEVIQHEWLKPLKRVSQSLESVVFIEDSLEDWLYVRRSTSFSI